jgi:hypothetical protein
MNLRDCKQDSHDVPIGFDDANIIHERYTQGLR